MKNPEAYVNFGFVAVGGICGALLRYGTNILFGFFYGEFSLLTATTIENLLGSFLMGILFTVLNRQSEKYERLNLFLLTGMLGSYTTYAGFMAEAFVFYSGSFVFFVVYFFSQIFFGVVLLIIGIRGTEIFLEI